MTEFVINNRANIEEIRERTNTWARNELRAADELLGGIESLVFALELGLASLPLTLKIAFPPAPDVIIMSAGKPIFGVEVTRVGWLRLSQVRSEAGRLGDALVEIGDNLLVDRPARRDKGASSGTRSGDFEAIRMPEEGLKGAGLLADESRARSMNALRAAIERKQRELIRYRSVVNRVWLFLIADGMVANWEDILTRPDLSDLRRQTKVICTSSGFNEVLLWRDRHGAVSLLA